MQKFETKLRETLPKGACERANICQQATERCKQDIFFQYPEQKQIMLRTTPERRWMDCYAFKQQLGMVFDKELGVYILPEWKEELLKRIGIIKPQPRTQVRRGMS